MHHLEDLGICRSIILKWFLKNGLEWCKLDSFGSDRDQLYDVVNMALQCQFL